MPKFTVLWFSGTGNTLLAARILAETLGSKGAEAEMVEISADSDWRPFPDRTLIFCWPVYSYGMPRLVNRFIRKIPCAGNSVYLLCTMGGGAGAAMADAADILRAGGWRVLGGTEILMPNNFISGRVPDSASVKELVAAAGTKIEKFAQAVLRSEQSPCSSSYLGKLSSRAMNAGFRWGLPLTRRMFKLDKNACTGCGVCANSCPAGNICMNHYPRWGKDCEFCLRCMNICPHSAIDIFGTLKRGRPQYIAPGTDRDLVKR